MQVVNYSSGGRLYRNQLLVAALGYMRRGWPILPLHTAEDGACSCKKPDCNRVGKHPRTAHGAKDATTDVAQVKRWWTSWPDANIGIAVGPVSGLVVVDIDGAAGFRSLWRLMGERKLPETYIVWTGRLSARGKRVGAHLYFTLPSGTALKNSVGALGEGLEVKAANGYVVAPPSLHASGRRYRCMDEDAQPLDAPEWLVAQQRHPAAEAKSFDLESGSIPETRRNDTLFRLGKKLRWDGLSEEEVEVALIAANDQRCIPRLSIDEVQQIAANVFTYADDESLLEKAWRDVVEMNPGTQREQFVELIRCLSRLRPGELIFLARKPIAQLLGCGHRGVTSLCAWAERQGIIQEVGTYIPQRLPKRYRVLRTDNSDAR